MVARRRSVVVAAVAAAVGGVLGRRLLDRHAAPDMGLPAGRWAQLGGLGRLYLAQVPQEADRGVLLALVAGGEAASRPRYDGLWRIVAERRVLDMAAGDVAVVDGWILSKAEARFAALVSLG